MERSQIAEILRCLPQRERTVYRYFRDRYALQLLRYCVGRGRAVRDIKRTRFARLLSKRLVRELLARTPGGVLDAERLECVWPPRPEAYRLTLGTWGNPRRWERWSQTSRPGQNLVLQLNFTASHERLYRRLLRPGGSHPFENPAHPISQRHHTLAWVRLEVDVRAGEALVEEVQQDWLREARALEAELAHCRTEGRRRVRFGNYFGAGELSPRRLQYYLDALRVHEDIWDEAALSAALWLLRQKLGMRRIWFHSFEGGRRVKHMRYLSPPRSLYTDLPRRFCFERTRELPDLLALHPNRRIRRWLRRREVEWYLFEF